MRSFLLSLIRGAEQRPRRAVAVGVLCMLLGLGSALTLRPGTAVEDMLPEDSASAEAMGRVLRDFRLIDDLVVLVDPAANAPGTGWTRRRSGSPSGWPTGSPTSRWSGASGAGHRVEAPTRATPTPSSPSTRGGCSTRSGRDALRAALEPAALTDAMARFAPVAGRGGGPRHGEVFAGVRGQGLLLGLECRVPPGEVRAAAEAERLLTVPASDGVLRLLPALNIPEEELDEAVRRLDAAATALTA